MEVQTFRDAGTKKLQMMMMKFKDVRGVEFKVYENKDGRGQELGGDRCGQQRLRDDKHDGRAGRDYRHTEVGCQQERRMRRRRRVRMLQGSKER